MKPAKNYRLTQRALVILATGGRNSSLRRSSPSGPVPVRERVVASYHFESGSRVGIYASGVDTETALDSVEEMIRMKRRELDRRNRVREA